MASTVDGQADTSWDSQPSSETCVRWGSGPDACVRPFDHTGQCVDRDGNTTMSIAARYLMTAVREEESR